MKAQGGLVAGVALQRGASELCNQEACSRARCPSPPRARPSPPTLPCPTDPFDADTPKKWVQPMNPRAAATHIAVTSDGLRTLLLVEGETEPVPLSPNLSPMGSPMHRSPLASPVHRSLAHIATHAGAAAEPRQSPVARLQLQRLTSGSGGTAVGAFSTIVLPQGSSAL